MQSQNFLKAKEIKRRLYVLYLNLRIIRPALSQYFCTLNT